MPNFPNSILALATTLERGWESYRLRGEFDLFVEFTLSLNGLTEQLHRQHLPGLVRACQELENTALTFFADREMHPIPLDQAVAIERKLSIILGELRRHETPAILARRVLDTAEGNTADAWNKPRRVAIVARQGHPWSASLSEQLGFFGFLPEAIRWDEQPGSDEPPLAIIFVPDVEGRAYPPPAIAAIIALRTRFPTSYFYCLSVPSNLQSIVLLQRAGADACVPVGNKVSDVLSRVLDLVEMHEQEMHRVLIVEDSATAVAHIRRSLTQHGIDSRAINDPRQLLETAAEYRPDAILMDMYMPFCTGVEVTSALRQIPEYQALPVIYLSSETDIVQQVEALRLGGDQFLTKPVNPIILASVVKTKIERYREMLYSGQHDSLTGLLNHSTSKVQIERLLQGALPDGELVVAMIDIDRFKMVNDTYGHPVGDQVIRSLAWLLRGRLRNTDLIGRYGGEEFIVALPGIAPAHAQRLLEQIREDFSQLPHAHAQGTLRTTFSCGIAALPDYLTASSLIGAADDALLEAKRAGRNRIVLNRPDDAAD
ncbi:response regulator receiver modulated diguanylate cyclase [Azonexus fungiphilus]|uniref:diguanylate cyclase n=1 Tax=Azonexus fungiphilus TaxID=146940 RepID=A0A495WAX4_9RHOO|nr:diguanylate cyclase [Azonexus fungiphilus]RKT58822.1 response regulator receiver modulated diguanylate cyclase [Azonexus fungiphilus]